MNKVEKRLALDDFEYDSSYSQLFELGDIVKIDFRTPQKSIEETAYICRYSNKVMLAEKIETREEFEWAKRLGCSFMQGYFFAKPMIMSKNSLTPLPVNFMRVMQLISQPEPEFSDIVDVISCDTAMCQRLLRLINSVYFGHDFIQICCSIFFYLIVNYFYNCINRFTKIVWWYICSHTYCNTACTIY